MNEPLSLPQNPEAEKCALAMMACNQSLVGEFAWKPELFFHPAHVLIFNAIEGNFRNGNPGTWIDIAARLRASGEFDAVGGESGLLEVLTYFNASDRANARYFFLLLNDARAYRDTFLAVQQSLPDLRAMRLPLPGFLEQLSVTADTTASSHREPTLADQINVLFDELERREPPERYSTGVPGLDGLLGGGLAPGELGVVAGGTSGGKSVLLAMAALTAALQGKPIAYFSLEMSSQELLRRMASHHAGIPLKPLHDNPTKDEIRRMSESLHFIRTLPLTLVDWHAALADILAAARRYIGQGKAGLILVDYCQLVEHPGSDTREQAVSEIARRLKNLAMTTRTAVLTASQLNDDGKLRESRAIGHHADHVILLQEGRVLLAKNRRGPKDTSLPLNLHGAISRFEEG